MRPSGAQTIDQGTSRWDITVSMRMLVCEVAATSVSATPRPGGGWLHANPRLKEIIVKQFNKDICFIASRELLRHPLHRRWRGNGRPVPLGTKRLSPVQAQSASSSVRAKCWILRPDGAPSLNPIWFYKHWAPPALTFSAELSRHQVLKR